MNMEENVNNKRTASNLVTNNYEIKKKLTKLKSIRLKIAVNRQENSCKFL